MKFFKDSLFHFLLIGALIFGFNYLLDSKKSDEQSRLIHVTVNDIEQLIAVFRKQWQRPPTEQELGNMVDGHVREQVFYREALGMGLEKNDTIVRRRMVQKMEFIFGDVATMVPPEESALQLYYQENAARYSAPGTISFVHIYLNSNQRGDSVDDDAHGILQLLQDPGFDNSNLGELGDRIMLPARFTDIDLPQVDRNFGGGFAAQLEQLEVKKWSGPVQSGFGLHIVYIAERTPSSVRPFDEVVNTVTKDYEYERRRQSERQAYQELKKNYEVIVDPLPTTDSAQ